MEEGALSILSFQWLHICPETTITPTYLFYFIPFNSVPHSPTKKEKPRDSFQNYQDRTNDAWAVDEEEEDDEEYRHILKGPPVNAEIMESTAMQVGWESEIYK